MFSCLLFVEENPKEGCQQADSCMNSSFPIVDSVLGKGCVHNHFTTGAQNKRNENLEKLKIILIKEKILLCSMIFRTPRQGFIDGKMTHHDEVVKPTSHIGLVVKAAIHRQ